MSHTAVLKELRKKYGDTICISGKQLMDRPQIILPLSPAFNLNLKGGIPSGTLSIFSEKPKCGKTSTVLSFIAKCQAAGKYVYYMDIEYRLKKMNIMNIDGLHLDEEHMTIIRSSEEKIMHAEDYLEAGEYIANSHPGCVIIYDSASALCSEKESTADIKAQARNDGPKLLASFTRKLSNVIAINDITMVMIQHLIANTSGYGPAWMEDGGNKIIYAMDTKMRIKSSKAWTVGSGENEKQIGLLITWEVVTGALGCIPGTEFDSYLRFNMGVDSLMELIDMGVSTSVISKSGTWFTLGDLKCQGVEKFHMGMREKPELQKTLVTELESIFGEGTLHA